MSTTHAETGRFVLPPHREAVAPPEHRGLPRDGVRLLVARPGGVTHHRFSDLPWLLDPGDLLVVNTSPTLAAAVDARRADGRTLPVHYSTTLDDGHWVIEPRRPDGPDRDVHAGDRLTLTGGLVLELVAPYPYPAAALTRLWRARPSRAGGSDGHRRADLVHEGALRRGPDAVGAPIAPVAASAYLAAHGRPIRYGYSAGDHPLADYQTVYATGGASDAGDSETGSAEPTGGAEPTGSAEMASAGRPISDRLLVRLIARGITVVPLTLHAGVSSQEKHEPPMAEPFTVPVATARLVNSARAAGSRVIAVGTTVTRALETVAEPDGTVRPARGWTDLVLGRHRPARVVTGLISGLHPPEAVREDYLWHEFGDSSLFLPEDR